MIKTRKSPIAKSLIRNSKAAYLSAIEIHNKPIFLYRYEIVTILIINAWELMLKAYIYKYHKKVKVILKDGTTKPFPECIEFTKSQIDTDFLITFENLTILYKYRNQFAHFYSNDLDLIIFSIIRKNVDLYKSFLEKYFHIKIEDENNLILLPIGFKKPMSPFDYISNESYIKEAPSYVKDFVTLILESSVRLKENKIEDAILLDYKINLTNAKRLKNADIIAGVNNSMNNAINFNVINGKKEFVLSDSENALPVKIASKSEEASATIVFSKLSDGIFSEINNVIDSNNLLAGAFQRV